MPPPSTPSMPLRLHLLRHAKSSWDEPDLDDLQRPLAPRGRKAARAMQRHLAEREIRPELVLCSPAKRTRQTLERVLDALGEPEVRFEAILYGASVADVVELLRGVPMGTSEVLVVGHSPWIEDLALWLARHPPDGGADTKTDPEAEAWRRLRTRFPTGALATLRLGPGGWSDLAPGSAQLKAFVVPRSLDWKAVEEGEGPP